MGKWAAVGIVAALMAAAFFLPEWLAGVNDAQLLDSPVIQVQSEEQEGFAESFQLTVAEKLLLMRGGSMDVLRLGTEEVSGVFVNISGSEEPSILYAGETGAPLLPASNSYEEEQSQKWERRMEAVKREIRSLQAAGGLPELWSGDSGLSYAGHDELLYMDHDTRLNFQVYHMTLESESYTLEVAVDVQSGQILSFSLRWGREEAPNWGLRGAAGFGAVWRNYWGMDSVGSGWYNEYNKDILERTAVNRKMNGEYSALGQISFTYGGQSVAVPLSAWVSGGRSCMVNWNM